MSAERCNPKQAPIPLFVVAPGRGLRWMVAQPAGDRGGWTEPRLQVVSPSVTPCRYGGGFTPE